MIIVNFDSENDTYKTVSGLWQYDYGQTLRIQGLNLPPAVEIHFSLHQNGGEAVTRIGVTKDGVTDVVIPDSMLENSGKSEDYCIYAFVYLSDAQSGQTEYRITMSVKSRPKPEAWSGSEETTMGQIMKAVNQIADGKADGLEYKNNILRLLSGEKELSRVTIGGSGSGADAREIELQKGDSAIQWRYVGDQEWTDLISLEEITGPEGPAGADGQPGKDGTPGKDGASGVDGAPGADGKDGQDGADGITPHIGDNGNWYIGDTDTGKPSRGETGAAGPAGQDGAPGADGKDGADGAPGKDGKDGADGKDGVDGKSAYQYAQDGGYTGTEAEFISKLAAEYAEIVERVEKTAEDTAAELQPNKLYVFPEMAELSITFAAPADTSVANEYHCIFQSGATATTLTLPDTIQTGSFSVDANKIYELSVLENCLTYQSWEVIADAAA